VEPVLESARLVRQLEAMGSELPGLTTLVGDIQRLVPDLVGVSLTLVEENLTVTFVEPGSDAARLDALHLLSRRNAPDGLPEPDDPFGPQAGVCSTLSLALADGHGAALDLYATTPDAFEGRTDELVALCSATATTTSTAADTDLGFETRLRAAVAPVQVAESDDISLAIGLLAAQLELDSCDVDSMLRETAARAGLRLVHLARYVIDRSLA
jgi:hypothetical protein